MKYKPPQDMTDRGLMVYRFNNPRKNTTILAALVGMTTKDFNAAVARGMEEDNNAHKRGMASEDTGHRTVSSVYEARQEDNRGGAGRMQIYDTDATVPSGSTESIVYQEEN